MAQRTLATNVYDAALARITEMYEEGHRLVVSFSGGKDSGVVAEMCIIAAKRAGRLPVEVLMRDEEIMLPGLFEYAERFRERPEVDFHWVYARQPIINVFSRAMPYWWVFDPLLQPEDWVRQPPEYAYEISDLNIKHMITPDRFPPAEGKKLIAVLGLRAQESNRRRMGVHMSGGHMTKTMTSGTWYSRPIYDWLSGDVWRAISINKWDYASTYTVMHRMGMPKEKLRIAPPTLSIHSTLELQVAAKAWPEWFERVAKRLPGVRAVAMFGKVAISPTHHLGETWEETYQRECIDQAPEWIAERAAKVKEVIVRRHAGHASSPLPEVTPCRHCTGSNVSWKKLSHILYLGDPLAVAVEYLGIKDVDPEYFRPGSGVWYPANRERPK